MRLVRPLVVTVMCVPVCAHAQRAAVFSAATLENHDNITPGGRLEGGTLTIRLVARAGEWLPEGARGERIAVYAFGEESGPLTSPGPLLRVPAGTYVHATVRNEIAAASLEVHGLLQRPAAADTVLQVPPGETREVRFLAGEPGTYHYWATTRGAALTARTDVESQLSGAFIVDPPGARPADRVFVIGLWQDPSTSAAQGQREVAVINGRSWPLSETLQYRVGDRVHWRILNLSFDSHAMHLHGFHFRVLSSGNGLVDHSFTPDTQPVEVTEHVIPGETFEMEWTPERAGNWLLHCHMTAHMSPQHGSPSAPSHVDQSAGMAGLVIGIRVEGKAPSAGVSPAAPRRLGLSISEEPGRDHGRSGFRFDVEGATAPRLDDGPVPGPVLVLTRGEPVEITIINKASDPTAVHWHGIELDSYYDGVPGWGGGAGSTTPAIEAGRSFPVRFTPPRAGTFIYHTHWHDEAQLAGGLYGALIVVEPGKRFDPTVDHVVIIGLNGVVKPGQREPFALNGRANPAALVFKAGVSNRLRLINITPNNVALTFVLSDGFAIVPWKAVAKDGAELPAARQTSGPARQLVSVGETYDYEITPRVGQRLWLEVRRGNGEWVAQARVVIEP